MALLPWVALLGADAWGRDAEGEYTGGERWLAGLGPRPAAISPPTGQEWHTFCRLAPCQLPLQVSEGWDGTGQVSTLAPLQWPLALAPGWGRRDSVWGHRDKQTS